MDEPRWEPVEGVPKTRHEQTLSVGDGYSRRVWFGTSEWASYQDPDVCWRYEVRILAPRGKNGIVAYGSRRHEIAVKSAAELYRPRRPLVLSEFSSRPDPHGDP